jgi:hypothetical protein
LVSKRHRILRGLRATTREASAKRRSRSIERSRKHAESSDSTIVADRLQRMPMTGLQAPSVTPLPIGHPRAPCTAIFDV